MFFESQKKPASTSTNQQYGVPFFTNHPRLSENNFFRPAIQRQPETKDSKNPADDLATMTKELDEAKMSLCQLALDFFKEGYKGRTADKIGKNTAEVLDTLMMYESTCGVLAPYIKLKPTLLAKGHYKTYSHQHSDDFRGASDADSAANSSFDANEWHHAVKKYLPKSSREEITKTGGFYNRRNDTVNLPTDSTFGNAVHESVHRLSNGVFRAVMGQYINEGVTQLFADIVLNDVGLPSATGHSYGPQVADAALMEGKVQRPLLANAYFQGSTDSIKQLLVTLQLIPTMQSYRQPPTEADLLAAIRRK